MEKSKPAQPASQSSPNPLATQPQPCGPALFSLSPRPSLLSPRRPSTLPLLPFPSARRSPAAVAAQRPCSQPLTSRARMAALSPPRRNRLASTAEIPGRNLAGFPISDAHAKAPSHPTNRSPVPPLLLPSRSHKP